MNVRSLSPVLALLTLLAVACGPAAPASSTAAPAQPAPTSGSASRASAAPETKAAENTPAAKALPADYFQGKTVTVLVNFSAGGPTDIFGRMLAQHLEKHIPGKPTIVVQNMPGAGGSIGANHLYRAAKKDGTVIGAFTAPFANQLFEGEGVQYDSAKFAWLGGVGEPSVHYAHKSLGIKTPQELVSAPQQVIMGGFTPNSSKDLSHRTFLDMLGVKYKYVTGYPGNADARAAVLRGEINYFSESLTGWIASMTPLVEDGSVFPMGQTGVVKGGKVVRDPVIKDIPTHLEIAEEVKGPGARQSVEYRAAVDLLKIQGALLRAIVAPPETDPAVVESLRKAVADTFADKEFQAAAEQQLKFQLELIPGEEAQDLAVEIIEKGDAEARAYLKKLSDEKV